MNITQNKITEWIWKAKDVPEWWTGLIKNEWQFRRLDRQCYRSLPFDCGRKWIWRIASVWRAKLSGESELLAADALRVSATRGSGHVWPRKLNRPPLPSGIRRRMWDIRRRWNVGRIEFRMWDIRRKLNVGRIEFWMWDIQRRWNVGRTEFRMWDIQRRLNVGRTEFFPGWNELCRASQGGPSACAREREPRGIF